MLAENMQKHVYPKAMEALRQNLMNQLVVQFCLNETTVLSLNI